MPQPQQKSGYGPTPSSTRARHSEHPILPEQLSRIQLMGASRQHPTPTVRNDHTLDGSKRLHFPRKLQPYLIAIQEEERRRLGRELHDQTCQRLALLVWDVDRLITMLPPASGDLRRSLVELRRQLTEETNTIRDLSHHLHPVELEYGGLAQALEGLARNLQGRTGIQIKVHICHLPECLPQEASLCLYRVAQEALNNIAQHAHAHKADLKLWRLPASLGLSIRDWGNGFDPKQTEKGLGLISMETRAREAGGYLSVNSRPGYGTSITVTIPISSQRRFSANTATRAR